MLNLLDKMGFLAFDNSELDQAISINRKGGIATVRDLVAEKCSDEIKAAFRAAFDDTCMPDAPQSPTVSINQLEFEDLKRVAIAVVQKSDFTGKVISTTNGHTYNQQQLIQEIEQGTSMGTRIMHAVRLDGILTEKALEAGKVRPRTVLEAPLATPAFDF